jgi:DNA-binding LacI/PurR family transcriptional regulator
MILVERDWQRQDLNATVVDGANRLLALAPRPTAVVVSSEPVAQALIAELSRRGLGIPEACSLVTYGGSSADDGGWLARVELPMEAIATAIPELIRRRLANPAAPALSMQFETTLHAGASLAPPPKG